MFSTQRQISFRNLSLLLSVRTIHPLSVKLRLWSPDPNDARALKVTFTSPQPALALNSQKSRGYIVPGPPDDDLPPSHGRAKSLQERSRISVTP
ncbi:hypothetical protein K443DRAFT_671504 [Laccaria amethystina LaAM-08-1]|uniref:Uncharacterized protein n=1 Tax=Laccaria amethystina LaAM-08-1 TaxID=1095629 RepID=A0A0C9Y6J5_9AGAR|nr:hypothetical protein K443DRAFT_671504 [Laccaria amethystina LaAM-08-1]